MAEKRGNAVVDLKFRSREEFIRTFEYILYSHYAVSSKIRKYQDSLDWNTLKIKYLKNLMIPYNGYISTTLILTLLQVRIVNVHNSIIK